MVKTDSVENQLTQFSEFCLATRSPILILLVKSSAIYGGASGPSIQFPLLSSFNCLAGEKTPRVKVEANTDGNPLNPRIQSQPNLKRFY